MIKHKKRFIAGAVCPRCRSVDKIYTLSGSGGMSRHCANCDFSEELEVDQKEAQSSEIQIISEIQVIKVPGTQ